MADTLDVLTDSEAEAAINDPSVGTVSRATELPAYVTAVSRALDELVGPVVQRTITDERHDGGRYVITLDHEPVSALSTVTEWNGDASTVLTLETAGSVADAAYLPLGWPTSSGTYGGLIRRRSGGQDYLFPAGRQNVVVTYTAGRYADTASVDARFKTAAVLMLKNMWKSEQVGLIQLGEYDVPTAAFPTFAVPNVVRQMLADEIAARVGVA